MRRALVLPLAVSLLGLSACERCDPQSAPQGFASRAPLLAGSHATVTFEARPPLALDVYDAALTLAGEGATLSLAARPRSEGLFTDLRLELALNSGRRGALTPLLQGSGCTARYLEGGLSSQADLAVWSASGELGAVTADGSTRVELKVTCRKRFASTTRGTPHAPLLPEELRVEAVVFARPPVHR